MQSYELIMRFDDGTDQAEQLAAIVHALAPFAVDNVTTEVIYIDPETKDRRKIWSR